MTLGLCFWILMLLWLVFGFAWHAGAMGPYAVWGNSLLLFLLLALLGWQVFGSALHK